MKNGKRILSIALALIVIGAAVCVFAHRVLGFDFGDSGTAEYVTRTYDVTENFRSISIEGDTEKIAFVLSGDGKCSVVCREEENWPHEVRVEGDTLMVSRKAENKWHFVNIGIITESPSITVYLPEKEYKALDIDSDTSDVDIPKDFFFGSISVIGNTGDVSCLASAASEIYIKTDTGDISLYDLSAGGMRLVSDTGNVELTNSEIKGDIDIREGTGRVTLVKVNCENLNSEGDTGKLFMTDVIASGVFKLDRTTGDISLDRCDAESIYIETDTGDVSGLLLSDKIFLTDTDTGKVKVPKSVSGGRCEIETDTGDISMEVIK